MRKEFFIKKFFDSYPAVLSNQQKKTMKKSFIKLIKTVEKHELVYSNYKIISNGKVYDTDQLTASNISEGFIVYEKLSI